jgi:hypothetical protein
MYINNNNNKRYHRNRETIDTSDTCMHDRLLYCSGTCTLTTLVNDSLNLDFHYNMKILLIIDARENRRGIQDI